MNDEFLIGVLDTGFVRLVSSIDNADLAIVRAARVSYAADWRAGADTGSDDKLVRYLWKHHHSSPFEAVNLTFEVKAPIFIFRQWHRHRTWSYNEVSARYTELPEDFYLPTIENIGKQSGKNKQARDIPGLELLSADDQSRLSLQVALLKSQCEDAFDTYRHLLAEGWPRELARMALPVNTYSRMFATVDLNNLFKFLTLRTDAHAQWEIQQYANALWQLTKLVAPVAVGAWEESRG